ncbi:hypothetical protein OSB04_012553 [Centaurea solstitialis]|uniref:DUF4371 domain-containing protein n=1 Tax=Centaurea solstitialis TaxID=347529 RepID=A0AA38TBK4_9ASTR|nr:hypothetical protein OSB04_012553 [Centaurea solstitialis]
MKVTDGLGQRLVEIGGSVDGEEEIERKLRGFAGVGFGEVRVKDGNQDIGNGGTFHSSMDKFLIKRKNPVDSEPTNADSSKRSRVDSEINLADLPSDPGMRIRILDYNPNIRDEVQRSYLIKESCQPRNHQFPSTLFGRKQRRFNTTWFDEYLTWLEYNIKEDVAYCLCCCLFKANVGAQAGADSFVGKGFGQGKRSYGFMLEVLIVLTTKLGPNHNESIEVVAFKNAPKNLKLTSPNIQKNIVNVAATETPKLIVNDLGDDFFSVFVDGSRDVSIKEQMSVVLQLTLVAVAKKHLKIASLFLLLTNVVNVVGGSRKCRDRLREQAAKVINALDVGEISSGRGLNKETSLIRAGNTRWQSHYGTMTLLGITNELSQALQRKEQDIVNAVNLVGLCKKQLQTLRDNGWDSMLNQATLFCEKHNIDVCNMDDMFLLPGRSRLQAPRMSNLHHYSVELFYAVIDLQLMELDNRFNETTAELLLYMSCLSPRNSFLAFDKSKLFRLAQFFPNDYLKMEIMILDDQLETYTDIIRIFQI